MALTLISTGLAQTPPIRIMPLGDSITDGSSFDSPDGSGGYRLRLFNSLTTAGYNVDYIGTLTINSGLLAEQNHEGHSGWRIDQLDTLLTGALDTMADPDVVLMHIGTNDFGQSFNTSTSIDRLDALILKIATMRPYCHIIVTNLMERGEPTNTNIQTLFNPFVQARVNAHATAGRRVTFLDMRAAVPLADMPDNLHPNQTGYDKMSDAWLPAIQAVIGTNGDAAIPAIARARGVSDRTHVNVTFSKPVADSAANAANFSIGGLSVTGAVLDSTKRVVTLTTSAQTVGTTYTMTVNGVQDRIAPTPNALPANSTANFLPQIPRGYLNHVPESYGYTLALSLDVPNAATWSSTQPAYSVDNRAILGPFDRVAYYVELQSGDGQLQYLWASMNGSFAADANQIGVPTAASGAQFQQAVSSMNVFSNVSGIVNGTALAGNLEFWPSNYQQPNSAGVSGASDTTYDFGDTPTAGTYGSMQLHNPAAGQTLFAINNWGASGTSGTTPGDIDIGIGNDPAPVNLGVDWTFHHNAASYTVKSLQVLVRTSADFTPPQIVLPAQASFGGSRVTVTFTEPVNAASIAASNFSLNGGVIVLGAALQPNQREVVLTTTAQPAGTPLTLTVNGVRDTSPNANRIAPNTTIGVVAAALPPEIVANVGAPSNGYQLVYSANIPVVGNFVSAGSGAYSVDDSTAFGPFSRVAYYLELQQGAGPVQYVWASMDAFTINRTKIGIPTVASGAFFQQNVTNLDVRSNVAGVTTGTTATGGNIEFWPSNYNASNALSVAGASATDYDWGDGGAGTGAGYGSMQIHNHDALQTVMAVNRFGTDGNPIDVGIGNNPAPISAGRDWTFASNAGNYTRRVLHVLVLPGQTTDPAVVANVPEAANYQLVYSQNLPTVGNLVSGAGFAAYSINRSADVAGFSRIGYYMELQKTGDATPRYVWTSMDAFTTNAARIGIPTAASGAVFQQVVNNLNVRSNVAGVVAGTGITTGNIEFWPTSYSQPVVAGILPGNPGSTTLYDFNDTRSATGTHGSMQVHNYGASQTLWAINNWGTAANSTNVLTMGIGNNPTAGQNPDYTLSATQTGASWDIKRVLQVYVLPGNADTTPPTITRAVGSTQLNRLVVTFSEPVAESAANTANFSIPGLTVQRTELLAGFRDVAIYTTAQTGGTVYTVNVSGVRDRSSAGNLIAGGASTTFTAFTVPAALGNVAETSGYQLVYRLAIPSATPQWNLNTIPYSVDEAKYGEQLFDRVAYYMELDSNWAYASFDRHTTAIAKTGVPTLGVTATAFQQIVTNMNVASSVGSIVTGNGIATGNIEFWGGNYSAANAIGIPNASVTDYDFGDTMTAGTHGSLQIHNHGASQVILAYNNWGTNAGAVSSIGVGSNPAVGTAGTGGTQGLDYTFAANAAAFTTRNLYVLVRPGGTASGPAPAFASHPTSRTQNVGTSTTLSVIASGTGLRYQWRKDGVAIQGATNPWLDLLNFSLADAGNYDVVVTGSNLVSATSLAAFVAANRPPVITGSLSYGVLMNQTADFSTATLLGYASDPDGDPVTISEVSQTTLFPIAGGYRFDPGSGFVGLNGFSVTFADGRGGNATLVVPVTVSNIADPATAQTTVIRNANGSVDIGFHGIPGRTYRIQRSIDLINWTVIQTLTPTADSTLPMHDATAPSNKAFYRTIQP